MFSDIYRNEPINTNDTHDEDVIVSFFDIIDSYDITMSQK